MNLLAGVADAEWNVELHLVADLEEDARVYVPLEALGDDLEAAGANRQVRKNIRPIGGADGGSHLTRVGLYRLDAGAGHDGTARIGDES